MGHTRFNRLQIVTLRPAPVQIHYMGSTQSVGSPHLRHLVTDAIASPPETQRLYTESLIYLPGHFFVTSHALSQPDSPQQIPSSSEAFIQQLPANGSGVVLCALNDAAKVSPRDFDGWMTILEGSPRSTVLWTSLNEQCQSATSNRTSMHGDRVLVHRFDRENFLHAYRRADLFLDTIGYGGQNTALQGLWLGVAALTFPGQLQKARALSSMLMTMNLSTTIARTEDDYRAIAVKLAQQSSKLANLRKYILQRRKHTLFNTEKWMKEFENSLRMLWDSFQSASGAKIVAHNIIVK